VGGDLAEWIFNRSGWDGKKWDLRCAIGMER
jgi:hypothetical protein